MYYENSEQAKTKVNAGESDSDGKFFFFLPTVEKSDGVSYAEGELEEDLCEYKSNEERGAISDEVISGESNVRAEEVAERRREEELRRREENLRVDEDSDEGVKDEEDSEEEVDASSSPAAGRRRRRRHSHGHVRTQVSQWRAS